ncbi:MAG: DUF3422 family protein, partial [Pseudomonadota bacterium]
MLEDHPLRREMIGELHSRPFLAFQAPAEVLHLAFKPLDPPISLDHEAALRRQRLRGLFGEQVRGGYRT